TFAEAQRREFSRDAQRSESGAATAAVEGASRRLRPILMTSAAMIAGMLPMAFALGEGGRQTVPLGRAVIGGLASATLATLLALRNAARTPGLSLHLRDRTTPGENHLRLPHPRGPRQHVL